MQEPISQIFFLLESNISAGVETPINAGFANAKKLYYLFMTIVKFETKSQQNKSKCNLYHFLGLQFAAEMYDFVSFIFYPLFSGPLVD